MKKILVFALIVTFCACTNTSDATRTLQNLGYTNINITGYRPFICGKGYDFSTGFSANAPVTKIPVTGAVCGGFSTGNSVKLD